MKTKISFLIFVCLLFCLSGTAYASPKVYFNDTPLSFNVPPQNHDGVLLVPLRVIFEALGASVDWNEAKKEITATTINTVVKLRVGQTQGYINEIPVRLSVPAKIIEGCSLVPLRFVSETFGAKVDWNSDTETVKIYKELSTTELGKLTNTIVTVKTDYEGKYVIGSGVIIRSDGIIITNSHVIGENKTGVVILSSSETEYPFKVLGSNQDYDIAVISINMRELNTAKIGNSDELAIGQEVVAIGNPLNFSSTVSTGIISGIREKEWVKLIQVTTPITFGSSGGGLFDRYGKLVGITALGVGLADLNFAIPINDVLTLINANWDDLIEIPQSIKQVEGYWGINAEAQILFSGSMDPNSTTLGNKLSKDNKKLFWHLCIHYPQPNKLITFRIKAKFYREYAENFFVPSIIERELKGYVSPTWTASFVSDEFLINLVYDNSTKCLLPGRYKVELYSEDKMISSGVVEIE